VTLVNVFSPEGGDFSEPVTQAGLRPSGACWLLDGALAQARRFPAIDLNGSYSTYEDVVSPALIHDAGQDWTELKEYLRDILSRERELSDLMRSGGGIALSEEDRWILFHAETLRIIYVQQNASAAKDACSSPARWAAMLRILKALDERVRKFLREGGRWDDVVGVSMRPKLAALRELSEGFADKGREWLELVSSELAAKRPSDRETAQ
jgi:V/A-type H+-transporting ATPase subunit A